MHALGSTTTADASMRYVDPSSPAALLVIGVGVDRGFQDGVRRGREPDDLEAYGWARRADGTTTTFWANLGDLAPAAQELGANWLVYDATFVPGPIRRDEPAGTAAEMTRANARTLQRNLRTVHDLLTQLRTRIEEQDAHPEWHGAVGLACDMVGVAIGGGIPDHVLDPDAGRGSRAYVGVQIAALGWGRALLRGIPPLPGVVRPTATGPR
jgi:hypothetical protein